MPKVLKSSSVNSERDSSPQESENVVQIISILDHERPFKNPNYVTPKRYRPLKQIISAEKASILGLNSEKRSKNTVQPEKKVEYKSKPPLESPPSLMPAKKYCDITGLEAPYLDPKTNLRFHSAEIYQVIKTFPLETPQDYLSVRNAAVILR